MEFFRNVNVNWMGKAKYFVTVSLILLAIGWTSVARNHWSLNYGIDFRGGAMMYVKFTGPPPVDKIRSALASKISGNIDVQSLTGANSNEVIIGAELKDDKALQQTRQVMVSTLESTFAQPGNGKLDFNNATQDSLSNRLHDPLQKAE